MNTRASPVLVFLVVAAVGLFTAWTAFRSATEAEQARFEQMSGEVAQAVRVRVGQHLSLLRSTRSYFEANGGIPDRDAFRTFVAGLDIGGEHSGMQGVGFALQLLSGSEQVAEQLIAEGYDIERDVWPETDQPHRAPIVLIEPQDERNSAALGFDMFSEPRRRTAMQLALDEGTARATSPVELVQEITPDKQSGFLVYIPFSTLGVVEGEGGLQGFVYAPFRMIDLFEAALQPVAPYPVAVDAFDVTDGEDELIYRSREGVTAVQAPMVAEQRLTVAGREWRLTIGAMPGHGQSGERSLSLVLAGFSLLLAGALAMTVRAQNRASESSRLLHAASERNLHEKEMMLQEMKHRIKNSIARILAMARQTASRAATLEEFNQSFVSRLQAMASAQDMLTRSHWQRADLKQLLTKELEQVFGEAAGDLHIEGPAVELDEKAAQALGLTFHELATNALKYGGAADGGSGLTVTWTVQGRGEKLRLDLEWRERSAGAEPSVTPGFGTRLIDASVRSELGGTITRSFEGGLQVKISVPGTHLVIQAPAGKRTEPRRREDVVSQG